MRWVVIPLVLLAAGAIALLASGGSDRGGDESESGKNGATKPGTAAESEKPTRGVATIAAELAALCEDKIQNPDPASPEIEKLVDELVGAYIAGPKNAATSEFMRVAEDNVTNGCGSRPVPGSPQTRTRPDLAAKIAAARRDFER